MGFWKRQLEHESEVGYRDPGKLVCARHFDSPFVVALVEERTQLATCDFCDMSGAAAELDIVLDAMSKVLWDYWDLAANQLGWDSAEGGYQGFHCDVQDAVEDLFEGLTDNEDLWADLLEAWLPETVCKSNAYGFSTDEALAFDWRQFVDETRSRTRYVFLVDLNARPADSDSALPYPELADGILGQVAALARDHDLLVPMPAGTPWVRARVHGVSERLDLPEGLCSPPSPATVANRMSPAGISMFYGASDELTALAEIWQPGRRGHVATIDTHQSWQAHAARHIAAGDTCPTQIPSTRARAAAIGSRVKHVGSRLARAHRTTVAEFVLREPPWNPGGSGSNGPDLHGLTTRTRGSGRRLSRFVRGRVRGRFGLRKRRLRRVCGTGRRVGGRGGPPGRCDGAAGTVTRTRTTVPWSRRGQSSSRQPARPLWSPLVDQSPFHCFQLHRWATEWVLPMLGIATLVIFWNRSLWCCRRIHAGTHQSLPHGAPSACQRIPLDVLSVHTRTGPTQVTWLALS
jgi:hypothetical protein